MLNFSRRAMRSMGEPLTESELSLMMKDADRNGDGRIDYEGKYIRGQLFKLYDDVS